MKYFKEQEQKKLRGKQSKYQRKQIDQSTENMYKNIRRISCHRLHHCLNGDTKYCMHCSYNTSHLLGAQVADYYKPKIPGIRFLGEKTI